MFKRLLAMSVLVPFMAAASAAYASSASNGYAAGGKSCTYQGGPKSHLWTCR